MSLLNKKGKLLKGRLLAAPLAILLLSASGCATTQEAELHEAITKSISVSQKQAIESKISNWFGGLNITIADDAFSQTASITIERKAKVDSRGLPIDGRHDNPVYSFTLNWFGGLNITIADDAFSQTASITIERKAKVDGRGLPFDGRHDNPVYSFTLLSDGEQCVLRNDQSGELTKLENVTCYIVDEA